LQIGDADREETGRFLRAAHSIHEDRLTEEDCVAYEQALLESPWGREHERILAGRDGGGRLLAALRVSSLPGAFDGRLIRVAHVRTPLALEGAPDRDHRAELMDGALRLLRQSGHALAIRMAPPGAPDRARVDFRPLPCSEAACRTFLPAPWPKEPAWLREGQDPFVAVPGLRDGRPEDIDAIGAIHAEEIFAQRLRIDRDRGAWEQILLARRLSHWNGGAQDPFWVIERGGRVEAYLLLRVERPTLRWCEHGARCGAATLPADLFWSALGWARREGLQRIEGWRMPDVLTVEPLYPTSDRGRRDSLAMLRTLDPAAEGMAFAREEECRLFELDTFRDAAPGGGAAA